MWAGPLPRSDRHDAACGEQVEAVPDARDAYPLADVPPRRCGSVEPPLASIVDPKDKRRSIAQ